MVTADSFTAATAYRGDDSVNGRNEMDLLARLARGEERAYEELVAGYGGRMLATAQAILRCPDEAQEALQEAFIQVFRRLSSFRGEAGLGTWLHRIAVNAALMRLRRTRRRPEVSVESLLPVFDETGHRVIDCESQGLGADVDQERTEVCCAVRLAIAQLPERYREIILLRDLEERSTAETARLLGITETAVKLRLHRARQALVTLIPAELRPIAQQAAHA